MSLRPGIAKKLKAEKKMHGKGGNSNILTMLEPVEKGHTYEIPHRRGHISFRFALDKEKTKKLERRGFLDIFDAQSKKCILQGIEMNNIFRGNFALEVDKRILGKFKQLQGCIKLKLKGKKKLLIFKTVLFSVKFDSG